jgi:hypothetical protein
MMGSLNSTAWAVPATVGAALQVGAVPGGELPSTDGNVTTIILGLTAFSLVAVVVGAWLLQSARALLSALQERRARRAPGSPPTEWPDASGGPR